MATQKPLKDMMPEIIAHYNAHVDYLETNKRLYYIWQGQLRDEVEKSLAKEIISNAAYNRAIQRIPSINIARKMVDKLSKVYIENPVRTSDNETDREIMHNISKFSDLDNVMRVANEFYNLHGNFAVEPFVEDGIQQFRVLGGHQFLPYSDDPVNPLKPTVMIKLLGSETIAVQAPEFDESGNKQSNNDDIRLVSVLALYSDDEFMIIDTNGTLRTDKMQAIGATTTQNPFGKIPFVYGNRSRTELIPFPNKETLEMSILIPKLFTDLNYAAQFMSHSIIYTKNTDLSNQEINPDAVVDLGERTEENGEPEIGVITPSVDIPNIIGMITAQTDAFFASRGIKTNAAGAMSNGNEASGVSKAIEEGDTTAERKRQLEFFAGLEMKMWSLIDIMEDTWASSGILTGERRKFSDKFVESFRIAFAEMKPLKTQKQKIEEIEMLRNISLISKKQSVKMLYPAMTDEQVDAWLEELKEEGQEEFDQMMVNSPMGDGQFKEGNSDSEDQDTDKRQEVEVAKKDG